MTEEIANPPLTVRQIEIITFIRAADMTIDGERHNYTAQDLVDRGLPGLVHSVELSLKGLCKKGMTRMIRTPRAWGRRKARYRLTEAGTVRARNYR